MNILRLKAEKGFTLIELLVVIAIIGILAAIAIPQFAAYRRRGYEADAQSSVRNLATAMEGYYASLNKYASEAGNSFVAYGFNQSTKINITVAAIGTAPAQTFRITGNHTSCAGGGTYTYASDTGKLALAGPCT